MSAKVSSRNHDLVRRQSLRIRNHGENFDTASFANGEEESYARH